MPRRSWLTILGAAWVTAAAVAQSGPAPGKGRPPELTEAKVEPSGGQNGLLGVLKTKFELSVLYYDAEADLPLELRCDVTGPEHQFDTARLPSEFRGRNTFRSTFGTDFDHAGLYTVTFTAQDKDGPARQPAPVRFKVSRFGWPEIALLVLVAAAGALVAAKVWQGKRRGTVPPEGTARAEPEPAAPPRAAVEERPAEGYAAFISYRRKMAYEPARLIWGELRGRGIRAFLDVRDLRAEVFDERLLREIELSPNFIIILTPGCLERCSNEGDWLRREIGHALETNRNIIPVFKDDFHFGAEGPLPPDIAALARHNGVPYSPDLFEGTIDRLVSFLQPPREG